MEFRDLKKQFELLEPEISKQINDVLISTQFISGPQVNELEIKLADYVGVKHCISCGNGTDAITIALMVWNIGPGDAVFVPDFTFFASGECPAYEGATPVFVDVEQQTFNINPEKLEESVLKVLEEGKYTPKVVIAVDLFGLPANYRAIREICNKYNMYLLEDGAQGFGGSINGQMACSFGDISTTSFFPAKPLGCYGDGGAIFTDNDVWADLIRSICVHGKETSYPNNPNSKYNNVRIGMNSRLDTLQAAILIPKLSAFKNYELNNVNLVAKWYEEELSGLNITLPKVPTDYVSSWAQYTIILPDDINRKKIQEALSKNNIPTMIYYEKPMHLQGAFQGTDSQNTNCPVSEMLCKTVLSLPMHPYMTRDDVNLISDELKKILNY